MNQEKSPCHSILVVEDDYDIRTAMVQLLESEGYHAESASNGQEALNLLDKISKPCLVLLDMMMPIMNGREFLDALTKKSNLAPLPVLIVSAIADASDTTGSVGFIKKPIDIEVVLKIIHQYCNN